MSIGFVKIGELQIIDPASIQKPELALADIDVENRFKKFAAELRKVAPKADDFLYFSAIFMHAAEASLINKDGSPKLDRHGKPITASWEEKGDSLRWVCSDPNVMPYKNSNGDIFRAHALKKAYKNFVSRPLCIDHKSSSVDGIRGVILDTYYDDKMHRIIGLCALDKTSYPELARKISTNYASGVSIGVGVGRAICSTCGNVARTERDFCQHMKTKSCYGEINEEISPIELSIVVQPADSQARIRTIIAAATDINHSLKQKEKELTSLSSSHSFSPEQITKIKDLEQDLKTANDKLAELKSVIEASTDIKEVDAPYGQSSGRYEDPGVETNQNAQSLNFPQRFAHNDAFMSELKNLRSSIEEKLSSLEHLMTNIKQEEQMADSINKEAYWQGGGGVNEPAPKQKKYPADPLNEHLRVKEDKQMVGQPPFPEVGDVDGMHPSPQSVDEKNEHDRKKMLLRAERRAAALQKAKETIMNHKEAYWQGGGGVNEPAPGQKKYPVDPLNEKDRVKEDKQMVGQKPFPDVGAVDDLHPSPASVDEKNELDRKRLLQRASLKARFVRAANGDGTDNFGNSAWHVYSKDDSGEKLVFTASVDELSGGRTDALFDVIATKEFGSKMLEKIRSVGLEKAASVYKKAQAVAGPGAAPGQTPDATGNAPVPAMPDMGGDVGGDVAKEDEGGKGDPKATAMKLAEKARDVISDLLEAVRTLTGDKAEMGDLEDSLSTMPKAAELHKLNNMRKELKAALLSGMKKSIAELGEHADELNLIGEVFEEGVKASNREYVNTVVAEAFKDAEKAVEDASGLVQAYAKYEHGTEELCKRAEEVKEMMIATADADVNDARKKKKPSKSSDEKTSTKSSEEEKEDDNDVSDSSTSTSSSSDSNDMRSSSTSKSSDESCAYDMNFDHDPDDEFPMDDDGDTMVDELPEHSDEDEDEGFDFKAPEDEFSADDANEVALNVDPNLPSQLSNPNVAKKQLKLVDASFDLTTKDGRAAYRAKLAADATGKEISGDSESAESLKFIEELSHADGLANGQTKLDTKPSDDLGKVETPAEVNKRMLEVARMPPKVRKDAERLNQLIAEGKVNANELDSLIAQGLDPEVVKYWKQYYGQAGKEGSEFAKMLTTETFKAKMAEEMASYRVKIARAYEFAHDMVSRGLLENNRQVISAQVDEIMQWNDEAFNSYKRVVAKHQPMQTKVASIPQVGFLSSGDSAPEMKLDLQSELEAAFANKRY